MNIKKANSTEIYSDNRVEDGILPEEDEILEEEELPIELSDDTIIDSIDNLSDSIEDLQNQVDDMQEDPINIEIDNNIDNHYIAECDHCHGIFISAVIYSGQDVNKISGICPLCDTESDQYLKWIIRDVSAVE